MLTMSMNLSPASIHDLCVPHWSDLTERLHTIPPWEWPDKLTPWLLDLAGPLGNGKRANNQDVAKLTGALALVNALGRLHRTRTGSVYDAFRDVRDRLLKSIRLCLSAQEVFTLLDAIDYEARSLEHAFLASAA